MIDLNHLFPEEKLQQHNCMLAFQEALVNLNKGNVQETCVNIMNTPLVASADHVQQIAANIFRIAYMRPGLIPYLVDICKFLIENQSQQNALSNFKDLIVPTDIPNQRWYRSFLINCINKQVISIEDFMSLLTSFPPCESIYLLFCWFAPVIKSRDEIVYEQILESFRQAQHLSAEFTYFRDHFNEMQKNNWELQRFFFRTGYFRVSYAYYLKNDDLLHFRQLITQNELVLDKKVSSKVIDKEDHIQNKYLASIDESDTKNDANRLDFDFDQRVESSLFERCDFIRHRPTLLQFAAFFGASKCFRYLIDSGANPKIDDDEGKRLIQFVIAGGNTEIFAMCENNENIELDGAIQTAVEFQRFDMMLDLLNKMEIDINHSTEAFPSIFHYAAKHNNMRVLLFCLEQGCPVNLRDLHDKTPLHYAAQFCQYDTLLALVDLYDIDINAVDDRGRTPLHYAAKYNKIDSVYILSIHPELDLNICDKTGDNPLILAAKHGCNQIIYHILSNNLDVNHKNMLGLSALHYAVKKGHYHTVSLLLTHYAIDINIRDEILIFCFIKEFLISLYWTPLHFAAYSGDVEMIKIILAFPGINISCKTVSFTFL
ncbi:hypothetical protein TRFO_41480 [Tritrichomonas foetus]|uniref:Uncharacterized protein n=1 Tax=Tritrichomonas foetus TaxID=1144522 RepID=A0A1J4L094_9EUKA|nr:hypothetical protein TRFO_41480 [Tritrichomonas foetus]|eukprot:OHT16883.1 hypothetical protein TRFO_41480 [Tritrichomonas foetus]